MAIFVDIANEIEYAKIAQYLSASETAQNQILKGNAFNKNYSRRLYQVRTSVEWRYSVDPTDESLNDIVIYMIRLIGKYRGIAQRIVSGTPCVAPVFITNPSSQSIAEGNPVTFTVVAVGTSPIAYQWQKNGVDLVGETSATYTISTTVSGDAGSYRCVVTNSCGTATSTSATLTITAATIVARFYYGDTNYYTDINSGLDAIPYQGTFNITGETLNVPFPIGAATNKFLVARVPRTETDKDIWNYDVLNFGDIPDLNFYEVVKPGGGLAIYTYYMTRTQMSLNFPAHTLDLSVSP